MSVVRVYTQGAGSGGKGLAWSHSERTGCSSGPLCLSFSICKRQLIVLFDGFQGALSLSSRIFSPKSQHGQPQSREQQPAPEEGSPNRRGLREKANEPLDLALQGLTDRGRKCPPSTTSEFTEELAQNHKKEPVEGWSSWMFNLETVFRYRERALAGAMWFPGFPIRP